MALDQDIIELLESFYPADPPPQAVLTACERADQLHRRMGLGALPRAMLCMIAALAEREGAKETAGGREVRAPDAPLLRPLDGRSREARELRKSAWAGVSA